MGLKSVVERFPNVSRSESSALAFLKAIKESKSCSDSSLLVLSSLFVNPENSDILAEALKVLLELGKIDAKMVCF